MTHDQFQADTAETIEFVGGPRDGETREHVQTMVNTLPMSGGVYRRSMGRRLHRYTVFLWEGKAA